MICSSMKKFFHYTSLYGLKGMLKGHSHVYGVYPDYDLDKTTLCHNPYTRADIEATMRKHKAAVISGEFVRGLWPQNRFIYCDGFDLPCADAKREVIEGLLTPYPREWNIHIPNGFDHLLGYIYELGNRGHQLILLEITPTRKDKVCVADWFLAKDFNPNNPSSRKKAAEKYWSSRIPFFEYTGKEGFKCPIVVSWNPIPLHQINVVLRLELNPNMRSKDIRLKLCDTLQQDNMICEKLEPTFSQTQKTSSVLSLLKPCAGT